MDSFKVRWSLDDVPMHATVTRPDGPGPFPAVVLVAGSGPTDRDWCSLLLPGSNGSGRLFATDFAEAGYASIRYDKRASGPDLRANLPLITGRLSMRSHLDELAAAVRELARQDFVDEQRIFGLGNSEGALHVLHYVEAELQPHFTGIILAAPPGRSLQDVLLSQLALQTSTLADATEVMHAVRVAADHYAAGEPMHLPETLPPAIRQTLAAFEAPTNLPFARELWVEESSRALARITVPTLVLIGGRDLQIDANADGDALRAGAAQNPHVTFAFPPNANHVFKEEHRTVDEILRTPGNGYNDPDLQLDPDALGTILDWTAAAGATPSMPLSK